MLTKRKTLTVMTSLVCLFFFAGCHFPYQPHLTVEITSHEDGQSVLINEEARITSTVFASRGVGSVKLFVDNELIHTDSPAEGTPLEFSADQPWTPLQEGSVTISVVLTDLQGKDSDPSSITLEVVSSNYDVDIPPTPEETATATPEGLELTQTAEAICTNSAAFIEDVTIPANTTLDAGSVFTKIWRVNNNGSCDWIGYELIHIDGDLLGASSPRALPMVNAGNNADISIDMIAPMEPGTYSSTWRIRAEDGTLFGPELHLVIVVPQPPTDTPSPTPTMTPTPTSTPQPPSVEQLSERLTIPANSSRSLTVPCPAGAIIVSGGFDGSDNIRIWHSGKDDNGWQVQGHNNTDSEQIINVFAVCLSNTGGTTSQERQQTDANPDGNTRLEVACPDGTHATGGGWKIGVTDPIEVYNSSRTGNGWQMEINNSGNQQPEIEVYTICLAGVTGATTQVSDTSGIIQPNVIGQLDVSCPPGSYVTGGGFTVDIGIIIYHTTMLNNGWQNFARNTFDLEKTLHTHAICYTP